MVSIIITLILTDVKAIGSVVRTVLVLMVQPLAMVYRSALIILMNYCLDAGMKLMKYGKGSVF